MNQAEGLDDANDEVELMTWGFDFLYERIYPRSPWTDRMRIDGTMKSPRLEDDTKILLVVSMLKDALNNNPDNWPLPERVSLQVFLERYQQILDYYR